MVIKTILVAINLRLDFIYIYIYIYILDDVSFIVNCFYITAHSMLRVQTCGFGLGPNMLSLGQLTPAIFSFEVKSMSLAF
jgi:hypothetical protein